MEPYFLVVLNCQDTVVAMRRIGKDPSLRMH